MEQRRRLFHRRFPEVKISLYHLRLVYREAGIKKKQINIRKRINPNHKQKIREEAREALAQVTAAEEAGHRIIYIDEFCTTKSTIPRSDWSVRANYPSTDIKKYHRKTIASIAAISHERGLELIMNFEKSVDQDKFKAFMKRLRQVNPFRKIAMFCD